MAGASSAERTLQAASGPLTFRDIAIVGGGCYGSFYASQLERARARGKVAYRRLLIIDRNPECRAAVEGEGGREIVASEWAGFFDRWLAGEAGDGDAIVPSPLMPHLMMEWLERRARAAFPGRAITRAPIPLRARTPCEQLVHAEHAHAVGPVAAEEGGGFVNLLA